MRHYTFMDYATQAYLAWVGLLLLGAHNATVPEWPFLLAGHGLGLVAVHGLIQARAAWPANRTLDFLRNFYPVVLYTAFYRETGALNQMFARDYLDPFFIRLEHSLFGFQPSLAFMDSLPYLVISEVFYAAYFSYYVMIAGVGVALFLRDRRQFAHYVSIVSFVFYVCYSLYIFLPVMGPRVFFREIEGYHLPEELEALAPAPTFPAVVRTGPFHQLMAFVYHHFEAPGAAFPSSHVAIALATLYFTFLYLPRLFKFHLLMVVLLCLATIYCRYHYVVDVFAGILTVWCLIPLGNRLYARFGSPRAQ